MKKNFVIVVLLIYCIYVSFFNIGKNKFVSYCEESIQKQLNSVYYNMFEINYILTDINNKGYVARNDKENLEDYYSQYIRSFYEIKRIYNNIAKANKHINFNDTVEDDELNSLTLGVHYEYMHKYFYKKLLKLPAWIDESEIIALKDDEKKVILNSIEYSTYFLDLINEYFLPDPNISVFNSSNTIGSPHDIKSIEYRAVKDINLKKMYSLLSSLKDKDVVFLSN